MPFPVGIIADEYNTPAVGGFVPTDISGCLFWLDFTDPTIYTLAISPAISNLRDKSASPITSTTQSNTFFQANYNGSFNGYTVANFALDYYDYVINLSLVKPISFVIAFKRLGTTGLNSTFVNPVETTNAGYSFRIGITALNLIVNSTNFVSSLAVPWNLNIMAIATYSSTGAALLRQNGIQCHSSTNNQTPTSPGSLRIGTQQNAGNGFYGYMGEFVIYDHDLTAGEISSLETYLKAKWTILPSPADFLNWQFWLDASETGLIVNTAGAVTTWQDRNSSRNFQQVTALNKPTTGTRTTNGLNVIDFDGTNSFVDSVASFAVAQPFTYIIVAQNDTGSSSTEYLLASDSTRIVYKSGTVAAMNFGVDLVSTKTVDTSPMIWVVVASGVNSFLRINGEYVAVGNAGTNATAAASTKVALGATITGTNPWNGAIAEVYATNNAMSLSNIRSYEAYLADKWNITLAADLTDPTTITGLQLWLDASDTASITASAGAVSQWNDKSGNTRHVTQATGANQPSTGINSLNGLNVITFDGTDDYLNGASAQLVNATDGTFSIFIVYKNASVTGTRVIMDQDPNTPRVFLVRHLNTATTFLPFNTANTPTSESGNALVLNTPAVLSAIRTASSAELFINTATGIPTATTGTAQNVAATFRIGAQGSAIPTGYTQGDYAEILVYNSALSGTDRRRVEDYLRVKWGF